MGKKAKKVKKLQQKMASQSALILSMPDKCKECGEPFDKKNKMMIMTWYVEVFNAEKRVDLYCPSCSQSRRKDEVSRDSGV